MGPTRKSRSVKKHFSYVDEVSPSKDGENVNKSRQRKRKLSDKLGTQWSKEELERFYEAYRKYGREWKKVAAMVRNRSVEMVEALYNMNRAYLSLPEGTASVVGLIAMMTDHYCVLGGSDSEQESNGGTGTCQKPQKRGQENFQNNTLRGFDGCSADLSPSQSLASSYGCLSLLKKIRSDGSQTRAVGKRTPRFPVSYSYRKDKGEKFYSAAKEGQKLKVDANDDVAHEVALALAEASQRGGSPQVSQIRNRRTEDFMSSLRNGESVHAESEKIGLLVNNEMDEDGFEGSIGSMEGDNDDYARCKSYLIGTEDVGTVDVQEKGNKYCGKMSEFVDGGNNHDVKEACSGTEEQKSYIARRKVGMEVVDAKVALSSPQGPRKRSRKVLFGGDEGLAFDALQTLADLSLMMPDTTDTESSVLVKDKKDDNAGLQETMPVIHNKKVQTSGSKMRGICIIPGVSDTTLEKSKQANAASEVMRGRHQSIPRMQRRKQKALAFKIPQSEAQTDSHVNESLKIETSDEGKKSMNKVQASQVTLPTKVRSRRKTDIQKPFIHKELKTSSENTVNGQPNVSIPSFHDKTQCPEEKLSKCLSWYQFRRWCTFEWFYSAIDYPWFAKQEFVEYLHHVGLGHVSRLTRVEWGVIRSSLGKPRRFSKQFLKEEKEKLNEYRSSVRMHYAALHSGVREGLPTDVAQPLSVGQRAVAFHPRTREVHDGSVLTVDCTRCQIQFDQPELGVEFIMDIDCMPSNPMENMPASLKRNSVTAVAPVTRNSIAINKFFENSSELNVTRQLRDQNLGNMKFIPCKNLENVDGMYCISSPASPTISSSKRAKDGLTTANDKVGCNGMAINQQAANSQPAHVQAKEADVHAISELTHALDKKEALVSELRRMNDEVLENQKYGDNSLKDSELFKKQYAAVLVQLDQVDTQVSCALLCLRQRNTYQGNYLTTRLSPVDSFGDLCNHLSSFSCIASHSQELRSPVSDIVESSRTKAQTMVDVAVQAMSSLMGGGHDAERIEKVIDYVSNQLSVDDSSDSRMPATRTIVPADPVHGSLASQDLSSSCTSSSPANGHELASKLNNASEQSEAKIPSELIAQCVATLLMIQRCTERQFPPAEVAQILDSAVTSLQPCSSQNLPIYTEIQKCMGIIRNQILALIPI
ncbi:protein ALWAYS EARLY 3-like isoform X2 [Malania oleifera]|uniref:protein ALWAYS EARLY 3-like isoform X2 n=1 Tax=Malania oleifera TaxID=397392 RepID=UPI0025ADBF95|nr:protein ALWAYS EARLY 3-like isoform X2 [Malania oleifera]